MTERGPCVTTPADWAAWDQLPEVVRAVLHATPDPYDPQSVLDQLEAARAAGWSDATYAANLARLAGRPILRRPRRRMRA